MSKENFSVFALKLFSERDMNEFANSCCKSHNSSLWFMRNCYIAPEFLANMCPKFCKMYFDSNKLLWCKSHPEVQKDQRID